MAMTPQQFGSLVGDQMGKAAFLGAAGRAIGGAVSNAVSGAVNAAKPMVTKAIGAMGTPIGQAATTAAAAGGLTAAAVPTLKHFENQRIDAQVDRQRARAMAQQPKPQTGMPQAPAPAPQPAPAMVGKQAAITAANNINPALAQQMAAAQPGVPSGPGGGLRLPDDHPGRPAQAALHQANALMHKMPAGQPMSRAGQPPAQGLNPMQQKTMRTVTGVGQPMPQTPATPMPASTGHGGVMGGGGPMSMSLAGKQAGAINELISGFGGKAMQAAKTNAQPMLNKAVDGVQTYGKRMMGDSTLKPLYQRADLMHDMSRDLMPHTVGPFSQAKTIAQDAYLGLLRGRTDAYKAINKERGAIDLTRQLTTGGAAAGTLGAVGMAARNNSAQPKQASLTEGLVTGIPGGVVGAGAGLGAGGLYGLLSGAYEAKKGKKLKGALSGLLRGAGGGALVGGGIGAGAGFGSGLMMPNILTSNPIMHAVNSASLALNPVGHAAKMTAGGIAGGVIGGRLANSQRKKMQDSKPTDNKKDDASESEEDTDAGEQLKSKAAALEAKGLMGLGQVGEGKAASEKEAARGDMVNKLMSYLKNRTLLQAEVVQPAGKAITGGWQTTSGVLGAPGGIHHHFSPSTVREVTTPPVLVRDLMQKAKDLMPLLGGMPERGGGYFDNNQKDLAGVVKQLYQAKKTGVR
jgi:hypothetical protein